MSFKSRKLGEFDEVSFRLLKLGELGEVSFRLSKLGELGKVNIRTIILGELGEVSFGMSKLCKASFGMLQKSNNFRGKIKIFQKLVNFSKNIFFRDK